MTADAPLPPTPHAPEPPDPAFEALLNEALAPPAEARLSDDARRDILHAMKRAAHRLDDASRNKIVAGRIGVGAPPAWSRWAMTLAAAAVLTICGTLVTVTWMSGAGPEANPPSVAINDVPVADDAELLATLDTWSIAARGIGLAGTDENATTLASIADRGSWWSTTDAEADRESVDPVALHDQIDTLAREADQIF
jgi:hypothetical protein